MKKNPLPRLDTNPEIREKLLPYCRLKQGEIWIDPINGHKVGCLDATDAKNIDQLMGNKTARLAIHDPPYNLAVFETRSIDEYIKWCVKWVDNTYNALLPDSSLYVWLGADQNNDFQPLPDFINLMREKPFTPRSMITMRNQRGYGTQKNWMAIRQELLYYNKGNPSFNIDAEYTDIPKVLKGYYKKVNGKVTENMERSRSDCIRAGNVWIDIQQVFYRMEENVSGCYAQKPMKCIDRIIRASSSEDDLIIDFFSHSGTTLVVAEILNRKCYAIDYDPIYAEITIRRLERMRKENYTGWQNSNPFEYELSKSYSRSDTHSVQSEMF